MLLAGCKIVNKFASQSCITPATSFVAKRSCISTSIGTPYDYDYPRFLNLQSSLKSIFHSKREKYQDIHDYSVFDIILKTAVVQNGQYFIPNQNLIVADEILGNLFATTLKPRLLYEDSDSYCTNVVSSYDSLDDNLVADSHLWLSSTVKKRRMKMNKHKLKKRRKALKMNTKQSRA